MASVLPLEQPSPTEACDDTIRLLIVDDDGAFRRLCREYLRHQPDVRYEITEASTGIEASTSFDPSSFDCVLVDYRLPDTSGTGLMRALQSEERASVPMIMLTAVGSEDIAMEAVHSGAADYMPKHRVSEKSLHRAISYVVEKDRLRRSVRERTEKLQRANEELRRKNDQIRRFYHTVSHEIKTPLTAAREFIALIAEGVMGEVSDRQRETLEHAIQSCDQIAAHFNDLIESTRLETGKLRIDRAPRDLGTLIRQSVMSIKAMLDEKELVLEQDIPAELPQVDVDGSRIVQVLSNLLGNAVKYTDSGGLVEIRAHYDSADHRVWVSVRDTGCGIPAEHLPRIFERLYQVDERSHASTHAGLGLGLSIAQEIVGLHGSELSVDSEVGSGTTFRFSLPAQHPPPSQT